MPAVAPKVGLLAALACAVAACGATAAPASRSIAPGSASVAAKAAVAPLSPPVKLKVGTNGALSEAGLYIGLERGYFDQEGLDIELTRLPSLEDMVPLLATGALDVGTGGLVSGVFNAVQRGVGLRIAAIATVWEPGRSTSMVGRKELVDSGQLKDFADFKGKTVGTTLGSVTTFDMALEKALDLGHLTRDDIHQVSISFPDSVTALANKALDVTFLPEPFAAQAVEKGVAARWKETGDLLPGQPASMWVYSPKLIESQPEAGKRFMTAMLRGVRDYEDAFTKNRGRADVVAALSKRTTVKDTALYDKMVEAKLATSGEIPLDRMQASLEWFKSHGAVPQIPDMAKLIDTSFTTYAVQRLGPYE